MKLKNIINYLDKFTPVKLYQEDIYIDEEKNKEEGPEEVFSGSVLDIPWIYLEYFLSNNEDGESISLENYNDKSFISIYLREKE